MRALLLTLALLCNSASAASTTDIIKECYPNTPSPAARSKAVDECRAQYLGPTFDKAAFTEVDALQAVAGGLCGSLPVGTGLVRGKGWLHQPIPGPVIMRLSGPGTIATIGTAPARSITLDMYAGRQSYIEVNAPPGSKLEWKVPGHAWGVVPVGFQLPPLSRAP